MVMQRLHTLLLFLILCPMIADAQEQDTVRVCTYNVLSFSATSSSRIPALRKILNDIKPQILLVQELSNEEGHRLFEDSVANMLAIPLHSTDYPNGEIPDSYAHIFFDTSTFEASRTIVIGDDQNGLVTVRLHHRGRGVGDSIQVITAQWKSGQNPQDIMDRLDNSSTVIRLLMTELTSEGADISNILFGGDLNLYSSNEDGYLNLTQRDDYRFYDPINRPGSWHRDTSFADLHTQSTRLRLVGNKLEGGLYNRFDHILLNDSLRQRYIPGSYTTFGNDGRHFEDSINAQPNFAVSPEIAQALRDASDHLPVHLDLIFGRITTDVRESELEHPLNLK